MRVPEAAVDDADERIQGNPEGNAGAGIWMERDETTVGEFRQFCIATGYPFPAQPGWSSARSPMVNVTWYDAMAFCLWKGGRLPTFSEWTAATGLHDIRVEDHPAFSVTLVDFLEIRPDRELAIVGSNPLDVSPCGMRDGFSNAREWLLFDDRAWMYSGEPGEPAPAGGESLVSGGMTAGACRYYGIHAYYDWTESVDRELRSSEVGFRVCYGTAPRNWQDPVR